MELIELQEGEGFYTNCSLETHLLEDAYIHKLNGKYYVFSNERKLQGGHWDKFTDKKFKNLKRKYIWSMGSDCDGLLEYYKFKLLTSNIPIYECWT